jgi:hypothetical protein
VDNCFDESQTQHQKTSRIISSTQTDITYLSGNTVQTNRATSLKRNVENLARKTSVAGISGTVLHKFLLEVIELIKPVNTILDTKSVTSA